jgi:hypothetical protein
MELAPRRCGKKSPRSLLGPDKKACIRVGEDTVARILGLVNRNPHSASLEVVDTPNSDSACSGETRDEEHRPQLRWMNRPRDADELRADVAA